MAENKKYKYVDYLDEDSELRGQKYVCLSFLSPEGVANCKVRGLKVRGVYGTREEAEGRCKTLQNLDPDFDVFVGEVGKWLPWNPDPKDAEDQEYQNKELNNLMKTTKENQLEAQKAESLRKKDLLSKSFNEESAKRELQKEQNKKSLNNPKTKKKLIDTTYDKLKKLKESNLSGKRKAKLRKSKKLTKLDKQIKEETKLADKERERLKENLEVVKEEGEKLEKMDETISNIQNLFKKLKKHDKDNSNVSNA